jgi:hypothetical protein
MRWDGVLYGFFGAAIVLFVVYLSFGGIVKLTFTSEDQNFSFGTVNCNFSGNYPSACYGNLVDFLSNYSVDNNQVISIYEEGNISQKLQTKVLFWLHWI